MLQKRKILWRARIKKRLYAIFLALDNSRLFRIQLHFLTLFATYCPVNFYLFFSYLIQYFCQPQYINTSNFGCKVLFSYFSLTCTHVIKKITDQVIAKKVEPKWVGLISKALQYIIEQSIISPHFLSYDWFA